MEKALFKIGDYVNFYGIKCKVTDVQKIDENTFEYTLDNKYKTIQESDWSIDRWEYYIQSKPYHVVEKINN